MKYFVGTYENKIDNKGRVSLPAPFRDVLSASNTTHFYIFPSPTNNALEAGGEDLIEYIAKSIEENVPMFSKDEETFNYIMANARLVSCDSTGRFVMPEEFSDFAGIDKSSVFVGNGRRFQLWSPKNHETAFAGKREQFAKSGLTVKKPTGNVNG